MDLTNRLEVPVGFAWRPAWRLLDDTGQPLDASTFTAARLSTRPLFDDPTGEVQIAGSIDLVAGVYYARFTHTAAQTSAQATHTWYRLGLVDAGGELPLKWGPLDPIVI